MGNPIEGALDRVVAAVDRAGEKWHNAIRAGMTETRNANRIRGSRNQPIASGGRLATGVGRLAGWSLRSSGGAATVTIYDGIDATADVLAAIALAPNGEPLGTAQAFMGPSGPSFAEGIFVVITGTVVGSLYFGVVD